MQLRKVKQGLYNYTRLHATFKKEVKEVSDISKQYQRKGRKKFQNVQKGTKLYEIDAHR